MTDRDDRWDRSWARLETRLRARWDRRWDRSWAALEPKLRSYWDRRSRNLDATRPRVMFEEPLPDRLVRILNHPEVGRTWMRLSVALSDAIDRSESGNVRGRDYRGGEVRGSDDNIPDFTPAWVARSLSQWDQRLWDIALALEVYLERPYDPSTETGVCDRCKAERHQGASYCWSCGGYLRPPRREPGPTEEDREELASRKRYRRCNKVGCPARRSGRRFKRDIRECPDCGSTTRLAS